MNGYPLTLLIQGKRHNQDSWKIIACRSDGSAEEVLYSTDIESTIVNVIKPALRSVSAEFLSRVQEVALSRIKEAKGLTEAQDLLRQGFIVKAPLLETHAIVDQVASWQKGEVLGFNDEAIPHRCIVSECMTSTSAYIAARI